MIKLKSLLVENKRKRSHCWLAPNGQVIPVKDTHDSEARRMLNSRISTPRDYDPVMELWKRGFLRVTYMYDGSLVVNNEVHPPNDKQIAVLKDIAVEGEHSKIEFDNGKDKPKILWSELDVLNEYNTKVEYMGPEDAREMIEDFYDQMNAMERESGISILSDKEVDTVAVYEGKVVGALYTSAIANKFSFDVIADPSVHDKGIFTVGTTLIKTGLSRAAEMEEAGYQMKLDVVNPSVERYLLRLGLKVVEKQGGHTIMTK